MLGNLVVGSKLFLKAESCYCLDMCLGVNPTSERRRPFNSAPSPIGLTCHCHSSVSQYKYAAEVVDEVSTRGGQRFEEILKTEFTLELENSA